MASEKSGLFERWVKIAGGVLGISAVLFGALAWFVTVTAKAESSNSAKELRVEFATEITNLRNDLKANDDKQDRNHKELIRWFVRLKGIKTDKEDL